MIMNRTEREETFIALARDTLLRRDQEARAILDRLEVADRAATWLLTSSLLYQTVVEHLGEEFDRNRIKAFVHDLAGQHRSRNVRWRTLHAEAVVRICYGETGFLTEIPQNELDAYAWAVLRHLVDPAEGDAAITARCAAAVEHNSDTLDRTLPHIGGHGAATKPATDPEQSADAPVTEEDPA